ncbi:hypothetical protein KIN20_031436 [Parelaphostrongylus tenuis]|uniref:Uncharacterized protein n=1 Tax=Parelaphostrongylus tenuis TaxID=148309 RepID=A0AAD5R5F3_PARTN|nr:hypothetical protein KIN20_031436 [Parelaphostrongylus tenuis]
MVAPVQRLPSVKLLLEEKTSALERTPISCWEIRNIRGDSSWYVEVDGVVMENFTKLLQDFISRSDNDRNLVFEREMKFIDVSHECRGAVKEELKRLGFEPSHGDDQTMKKLSRMRSLPQLLGLETSTGATTSSGATGYCTVKTEHG